MLLSSSKLSAWNSWGRPILLKGMKLRKTLPVLVCCAIALFAATTYNPTPTPYLWGGSNRVSITNGLGQYDCEAPSSLTGSTTTSPVFSGLYTSVSQYNNNNICTTYANTPMWHYDTTGIPSNANIISASMVLNDSSIVNDHSAPFNFWYLAGSTWPPASQPNVNSATVLSTISSAATLPAPTIQTSKITKAGYTGYFGASGAFPYPEGFYPTYSFNNTRNLNPVLTVTYAVGHARVVIIAQFKPEFVRPRQ